ncbi:MAG TPA: acetyl-CoA carboxylase biotin carboxyl carrier protein [Thermoanaerobaculia bacterium]|nr:acetyl-CoA carboxylase biotin carboxyl carrier protein [Thermoanaerobaculia bacterium]
MNLKEILELIDKVAERGIAAVEVEQAGTRLRIEGKLAPPQQVIHTSPAAPMAMPMTQAAAPAPAQPAPAPEADSEAGLHIVTSPIVGTFYRSPNPESEPYASVGDHISKGKVLCIVEAMKLMNEIESDIDGTVVRIYPQNGQPVEYGEKLFAVRL